jgi:hypothetical protein
MIEWISDFDFSFHFLTLPFFTAVSAAAHDEESGVSLAQVSDAAHPEASVAPADHVASVGTSAVGGVLVLVV